MLAWLESHSMLFSVMGVFSVVAFIATLFAVPIVVCRLPADYFVPKKNPEHPLDPQNKPLKILKNVLGVVVILMGILMLVLPGQGLLTILLGVSLLDFPHKKDFEIWLVSYGPIYRSMNWIRQKNHRLPLIHPSRPKKTA